jgi:hypothetical protein
MDLATVLGPYLLVAGLAALWALAEILQTFRSDARRATRTWWSALLVGFNAAFALLVYAVVRSLVPASADSWLLALAAGAGWQALLRTRVNLLQPLNPDAGEALSLSLADFYSRLQQFCWEQIDQNLAMARRRLLERASRLPVEELERQARFLGHAFTLRSSEEVEEFIQRLKERDPDQRSLLLASFLLRWGGYDLLESQLKEMEKSSERSGTPPHPPPDEQPSPC